VNASLPAQFLLKPCCHCGATGKVEVVNHAFLRFVRLQAQVSLREMARRLGVSAAYVCDVEYGRRACPVAWLERYRALWDRS
jgi:predicted transcriptional regulator